MVTVVWVWVAPLSAASAATGSLRPAVQPCACVGGGGGGGQMGGLVMLRMVGQLWIYYVAV